MMIFTPDNLAHTSLFHGYNKISLKEKKKTQGVYAHLWTTALPGLATLNQENV